MFDSRKLNQRAIPRPAMKGYADIDITHTTTVKPRLNPGFGTNS
jgi:hypothetical protein